MSGRRVGSGIAVAGLLVLGFAAMFIVPSSYAIDRDHSRWFALALGALAFPLAPMVWHLVGELRRRRARGKAAARAPAKGPARTPAKSAGLTGVQRLLLRSAVVAVVAFGGTWAIGRGEVWSALRHHALWFTDWSDPDPIADSQVLQRVPAAAEAILWIRKGHSSALMPLVLSGELEAVIAYDKADSMIVIAGTDAVLDQVEPLAKMGRGGVGLERTDSPSGMRILATPGWRNHTSEPAASLLALLREAPDDAVAIAVARPVTIERNNVMRSFVGWARVDETHVTFAAQLEAIDAASADVLMPAIKAAAERLPASKDCGNRAFADVTDTNFVRDGLRFKGTARLPLEAARGIPACMAQRGF